MRREIGGKELGKRRASDAGASVFTTNPSRAGPCLNDVGKRHIFFFLLFFLWRRVVERRCSMHCTNNFDAAYIGPLVLDTWWAKTKQLNIDRFLVPQYYKYTLETLIKEY